MLACAAGYSIVYGSLIRLNSFPIVPVELSHQNNIFLALLTGACPLFNPYIFPCLYSRCKIVLCTKGRVYQAVAYSILLYGCQTWLVRVGDEILLEVFDIYCTCWGRAPNMERRRHHWLAYISGQFVRKDLRWVDYAARCPEGELIRGLCLPMHSCIWR